jgi:plasmid maintenance system killer protein
MAGLAGTHGGYLSSFGRSSGANWIWVDAAHLLGDLRSPPGNRLESVKGDLLGAYSIRVNDQYRVTFEFEDGNAFNVTCEDYH